MLLQKKINVFYLDKFEPVFDKYLDNTDLFAQIKLLYTHLENFSR